MRTLDIKPGVQAVSVRSGEGAFPEEQRPHQRSIRYIRRSLCFYLDGSAYINQDEKSQGISAGNTGGGEVNINLPKDFYKTMSAKDVAGECWGNCYDDILERGVLNSLMKKAAKKNGFFHDYSKKS